MQNVTSSSVQHRGLIHHLHVFHAGAKPFSCSVCRKRFQDRSGLNRHFKIHTGERHFTCQICNKSFLQKQTLICHTKTHSKPCRKSTDKSNNIQINDESEKSSTSDQTSGDRIQFDADGKSFISLECQKLPRLEQTLSDQADVELGRMRLENCKNSRTGQTLDNRSSIESIDGADKPFQCTKCDKRFTLKRYILRHMRTHTNLRPYACAVCKKEFSIKMYLASHMKIHTGERPFACTRCEKKFKTRQGLGYHMKSHTESNMNCSKETKS